MIDFFIEYMRERSVGQTMSVCYTKIYVVFLEVECSLHLKNILRLVSL